MLRSKQNKSVLWFARSAVMIAASMACFSTAATSNAMAHPGQQSIYGTKAASLPHDKGSTLVHLPVGTPILPPSGFLEMCARQPSECSNRTGSQLEDVRVEARLQLQQRVASANLANQEERPASIKRTSYQTFRLLWQPSHRSQLRLIALSPFSAPPLADLTVRDTLPNSLSAPQTKLAPAQDARVVMAFDQNDHFPNIDSVASSDDNISLESLQINQPVSLQAEPDEVAFDKRIAKLLQTINAEVNRSMIPDTDQDIYHVKDFWNAPGMDRGNRGDCEDFALQKRLELLQRGVPMAAMSLAIVRTMEGDPHAVLVISTSDGDYVLDNLSYKVKRWNQTGYVWISRQFTAAGNALGWVSLS